MVCIIFLYHLNFHTRRGCGHCVSAAPWCLAPFLGKHGGFTECSLSVCPTREWWAVIYVRAWTGYESLLDIAGFTIVLCSLVFQIIRDIQLMGLVALLVLVDVVVLAAWGLTDPIKCSRSVSALVKVYPLSIKFSHRPLLYLSCSKIDKIIHHYRSSPLCAVFQACSITMWLFFVRKRA